jgi:hypothetical protein
VVWSGALSGLQQYLPCDMTLPWHRISSRDIRMAETRENMYHGRQRQARTREEARFTSHSCDSLVPSRDNTEGPFSLCTSVSVVEVQQSMHLRDPHERIQTMLLCEPK